MTRLILVLTICWSLSSVVCKREAIAVLGDVTAAGSNYTGYVEFTQISSESPISIRIVLNQNSALTNGEHGFHIHALGNIKGSCGSATGHYNPLMTNHGAKDSAVRHVGDLGNILIENNSYNTVITDKTVSLFGKYSIIGRSVVLHEGKDDLGLTGTESSKKTGNAGARLACGVIGINSDGYDSGVSSPSLSVVLLVTLANISWMIS